MRPSPLLRSVFKSEVSARNTLPKILSGLVPLLFFLGGGATPAVTVDTVGGTAYSATPNPYTGKGNAFRVDSSTTLLNEEFFLSFSGPKTVSFYVYQSPVEFGTYSRIFNTSASFVGTGAANWYSSGPMSVPLNAGLYYITAFSSPSDITYFYYFNVGDSQAVSFGAQTHGFATGVDPLGATITSSDNDQAIYYERLTTAVPEPSILAFLALGIAGTMSLRRRKQ